jgi:hypothetical protein
MWAHQPPRHGADRPDDHHGEALGFNNGDNNGKNGENKGQFNLQPVFGSQMVHFSKLPFLYDYFHKNLSWRRE